MSTSTSRIASLVKQITVNTQLVEQYLKQNGLPLPSFSSDGPTTLVMADKGAEQARIAAIGAAMELQDLLQGPQACLRPAMNATALEAIYRWDIPRHVPLDGEISFEALAALVGMPEPTLRRVIRFAIIYHRIFLELREGFVSHSAASRLLVEDSVSFDCLGMMFDESWQAFARTCDALKAFGGDEPTQTGYALAHCPDQVVWDHYKRNPTWARRFANSMKAYTSNSGQSLNSIVYGYPWSSLAEGSIVVDIGGSEGHVSEAIAEQHPHLNFIVQDLPEVIKKVNLTTRGKIQFMEQDFLSPQNMEADIYLFRWIFHDWPDAYVIKILQNLVPKLKMGARVVINEQLMPASGTVPLVTEKQIRFFDMVMLSFFNGREREFTDWERLFPAADPRFHRVRSWKPPNETFAIVEATWAG